MTLRSSMDMSYFKDGQSPCSLASSAKCSVPFFGSRENFVDLCFLELLYVICAKRDKIEI
jgi:hypothetical protein